MLNRPGKSQPHDLVPHLPTGHCITDLDNTTGEVKARGYRESALNVFLQFAGAQASINRVDPRGRDLDQHLLVTAGGFVQFTDLKDLCVPMGLVVHSAHRISLSQMARTTL